MAYLHSRQIHKKQKRSKKAQKLSLVIVVTILVVAFAIIADNFFNRTQSSSVVSTGTQSRVESASISIFRTPYFQFQTDQSWREVTDQDNPNKFVYRSYDANLVLNQFIVEIDDIASIALDNVNVTRVIPIRIEGSRLAAPFGISEHCETLVRKGKRSQSRISFNESEFPCTPDGSSFVVVASMIGGNEIFSHTASDGTSHSYRLTFQDSTFTPRGRALRGIIDSFQLL
jgi:hypothetical protein